MCAPTSPAPQKRNAVEKPHIILYDTKEDFENLLPITFTRPISAIRLGITTLREKWEAMLPSDYCVETADFMSDIFPCDDSADDETLHICSSLIPTREVVEAVAGLRPGERLLADDGYLMAYRGNCFDEKLSYLSGLSNSAAHSVAVSFEGEVRRLRYVFDIFLQNGFALEEDFRRLTAGRESAEPYSNNLILGPLTYPDGLPRIFVEEGGEVEGANLNLREGPIYIGKDARIMEGSSVRGGLALCERAQVRMGAKIYGATTLGPYCKAGGELSNVVMIGYSNKSHDGYLGNAVIGEWCNIGAGVNASNLKNDYSKIRIWNYPQGRFMRTDLQFCGLIMGDHSKAGVNCMFNTATVLGVGVNVYGSGFPRVFVPSFSEGSASAGFSDVSLKKFFEVATRVMGRRGKQITEKEQAVYEHIYRLSQEHKR
ncbi:MAG: glucose-1-phosphate thymidylyltransferase [Muribaculaceae bacterium]|nr:glucose-1-phosphate thymidylyltransferase [Muribaculaceae bacterium]